MKKIIWLTLIYLLLACKKEDSKPATTFGKVKFKFLISVGDENLSLYKKYLSPAGDTFTVERFKYYITDFTLVSGETQKKLKGSYLFSTDWKDSVVFDIETGNYDKLIFSIGVDSVANKGLDQSNDLDPSNDMSWDWNTGYKFLLLEGRYSTLSKKGGIVYHIGENKNYKTLQFNLVESVKIINEQQSAIIIKTDILGLFKPNEVDLDVLNNAQFGANVTIIADNYSKSMFSISQIINP